MEIHSDFKELLGLLNSHGVDYIIVGGYALAFHGAPRYTGDLDIFVRPDPDNAQRIMAALEAFGFGEVGLSGDDFVKPDQVIQLGVAPVRVDLITGLTGVSWEEAFSRRIIADYDEVRVPLIGRDQLIANKQALGRNKDLADIEAMKQK